MSAATDSRKSHFVFGWDENLAERRGGTYACSFLTPSIAGSLPADGSTNEAFSEPRKHHFQIGTESEKTPKSSFQEAFVEHAGHHKASLAKDVKADLRASHFSVGTVGEISSYVTTSQAALADHSGSLKNDSCRIPPVNEPPRFSVIPYEEDVVYGTEAGRAFKPHWGVHGARMAKSVKEDLRKSHFSHTMPDSPSDFTSTAQASFGVPGCAGRLSKASLKAMKQELMRSHFTVWEGSMKDSESETHSAFK